jgi:hypothetical protein
VKNLKVGIKKIQDNTTRLWVTQTIAAPEGIATLQSDLPSPGNYHVKKQIQDALLTSRWMACHWLLKTFSF